MDDAVDKGCGRLLDVLNLFLADVRDGLGPYLAIYLLTIQNWDQASIGLVLSIGVEEVDCAACLSATTNGLCNVPISPAGSCPGS